MSQVSYGTITITDTTDIERIYVEYCRSTSNQLDTSVNPPVVPNITVAWSENTPPWVNGQYIWQRSVVKKSGSTNLTYGTPVCLTGAAGATGAAGQSLTATKTEYTIAASNVTINLSNHTSYTWTTNTPDYDSSKPAYWGRITNTYTNPAKTEYLFYKDEALTKAVADAAIANSIAQHSNENAQGAMSQATATQVAQEALAHSLRKIWINENTVGDYVAGTYAASGLTNGEDSGFKTNDPSTYGFNSLLRHTFLSFRYNTHQLVTIGTGIATDKGGISGLAINTPIVDSTNKQVINVVRGMELTSGSLTFYKPPTIDGTTVTPGGKGMELTGTALKFYRRDTTNNTDVVNASFSANKIVLGEESKTHMEIISTGQTVVDEYKNVWFETISSIESTTISTMSYSNIPNGTTEFVIANVVADTYSVYLNNVAQIENIDYERHGNVYTFYNSIAGGSYLEINYYTPAPDGISNTDVHYTLGVRDLSKTTGFMSVAEGKLTIASGIYSHAEGDNAEASGMSSHAEGQSEASGEYSHAEGYGLASGDYSHAEGGAYNNVRMYSRAKGMSSHAEGYDTLASGDLSHAQNMGTYASYTAQTAIGKYNSVQSDTAFEIGNGTSTTARSNALTVDWNGNVNIASGAKYKINGTALSASDIGAQSTLVSGTNIKTINNQSLLGSGNLTILSGLQNLVDGSATGSIRGIYTAEEDSDYIMGAYAFAEGYTSVASGQSSHAEGFGTQAAHTCSHAEGKSTVANGRASHAEGTTSQASGANSHAQNLYTIAAKPCQTTIGKYNIEDTATETADQKALIIGNGTADDARSNALTVDWNGNVDIASGAKYKINGSPLAPSDIGIHMSTSAPTSSDGNDGDIWIVYLAN